MISSHVIKAKNHLQKANNPLNPLKQRYFSINHIKINDSNPNTEREELQKHQRNLKDRPTFQRSLLQTRSGEAELKYSK